MKNKILYIIILTAFSCKAQIVPLNSSILDNPEGTYFKDIENDLNKFEGTWKWEDGNDSFEMVLEKKEEVHDETDNIYEDMVVGEYKYIENGVEIINTLPRLTDPSITDWEYYISGVRIMHKNHPPLKCNSCTNEERRVQLYFHDPGTPHISMQIILRHVIDNGEEKLEAMIMGAGSYIESTTHPNTPRIPFGEYFTLTKQ